jgi:hypothetical protein
MPVLVRSQMVEDCTSTAPCKLLPLGIPINLTCDAHATPQLYVGPVRWGCGYAHVLRYVPVEACSPGPSLISSLWPMSLPDAACTHYLISMLLVEPPSLARARSYLHVQNGISRALTFCAPILQS